MPEQKLLTEELLLKYPLEKCDISEFHTKVNGTSFRNPDHIAKVNDGDYVMLVRDPMNADPNAVMVMHDSTGNHIGYIPKETAPDISRNILEYGDLYVGVVTITGRDKENQGMNLKVKRCHLKEM